LLFSLSRIVVFLSSLNPIFVLAKKQKDDPNYIENIFYENIETPYEQQKRK